MGLQTGITSALDERANTDLGQSRRIRSTPPGVGVVTDGRVIENRKTLGFFPRVLYIIQSFVIQYLTLTARTHL